MEHFFKSIGGTLETVVKFEAVAVMLWRYWSHKPAQIRSEPLSTILQALKSHAIGDPDVEAELKAQLAEQAFFEAKGVRCGPELRGALVRLSHVVQSDRFWPYAAAARPFLSVNAEDGSVVVSPLSTNDRRNRTVLCVLTWVTGVVFALCLLLGIVLPLTVTVGLTVRAILQILGSGVVFFVVRHHFLKYSHIERLREWAARAKEGPGR